MCFEMFVRAVMVRYRVLSTALGRRSQKFCIEEMDGLSGFCETQVEGRIEKYLPMCKESRGMVGLLN